MVRYKIAPSYSADYLETERPQPLTDNKIELLIQEVLAGQADKDITDQVYVNFKKEMTDWLLASKLNNLYGFDDYKRLDIINGCTHFIDNIYMQGHVQVLRGDYRYHERLGLGYVKDLGSLVPGIPLIIAMPFPSTGAVHNRMTEILDEAQNKDIDVHVDGAWLTCCRGIDFDVSHPAIKSVGISLSKGLGLGWNRIGLRWTRDRSSDSISIMNDFHMELRMSSIVGNYILNNVQPDYLWNTHGDLNTKLCKDFNLVPSKAIHLAFNQNGNDVGLSPLLRYLMK